MLMLARRRTFHSLGTYEHVVYQTRWSVIEGAVDELTIVAGEERVELLRALGLTLVLRDLRFRPEPDTSREPHQPKGRLLEPELPVLLPQELLRGPLHSRLLVLVVRVLLLELRLEDLSALFVGAALGLVERFPLVAEEFGNVDVWQFWVLRPQFSSLLQAVENVCVGRPAWFAPLRRLVFDGVEVRESCLGVHRLAE